MFLPSSGVRWPGNFQPYICELIGGNWEIHEFQNWTIYRNLLLLEIQHQRERERERERVIGTLGCGPAAPLIVSYCIVSPRGPGLGENTSAKRSRSNELETKWPCRLAQPSARKREWSQQFFGLHTCAGYRAGTPAPGKRAKDNFEKCRAWLKKNEKW